MGRCTGPRMISAPNDPCTANDPQIGPQMIPANGVAKNREWRGLHKCHKLSMDAYVFSLRPWQVRTHCCGHIVADTNVSPFARALNICCGHKKCFWFCSETFCVPNKCFPICAAWKHNFQFVSRAFARPRNIMSNNVSSFASTFKPHRKVTKLNSKFYLFLG